MAKQETMIRATITITMGSPRVNNPYPIHAEGFSFGGSVCAAIDKAARGIAAAPWQDELECAKKTLPSSIASGSTESTWSNSARDFHVTVRPEPIRFFVKFRDKALSGWGRAKGGKSYIIIPCSTHQEAESVAERANKRNDFVNVNILKRRPYPRNHGDHFAYHPSTWLS